MSADKMSMVDAPSHYGPSEASAWASGYNAAVEQLINTPHTHDFIEAVRLEMPHQRERWGATHDAGKTPADWFWLVGYLRRKARHGLANGNLGKARPHALST